MSAGYSGTPLARKLGIKPDASVALLGTPEGFMDTLDGLPPGVMFRSSMRGTAQCDVIVWLPRDARDLHACFSAIAARLVPAGGLWVGWAKKSSGVQTDLSDGVVRAVGLHAGLVDNKVCAISEVYAGLRFVVRVSER